MAGVVLHGCPCLVTVLLSLTVRCAWAGPAFRGAQTVPEPGSGVVPAVPGYRSYRGYNCWQGSFDGSGAISLPWRAAAAASAAAACAEHCAAAKTCEGFVVMPSQRRCLLRTSRSDFYPCVTNEHFDSYVTERWSMAPPSTGAKEGDESTGLSVHGYKHLKHTHCAEEIASAIDLGPTRPTDSLQRCAELCNAEPSCKGFVLERAGLADGAESLRCGLKASVVFGKCDHRAQRYGTYVRNAQLAKLGDPCSTACSKGIDLCCEADLVCQGSYGSPGVCATQQ
ncbi:unnamed protein product [Durusdinium trenchii]|uniref:Apple domain-containing protein n=2 Tax=Durusdinium trenchii TaxID=1381693 RepID=A0ABP0K2M1_9DINO